MEIFDEINIVVAKTNNNVIIAKGGTQGPQGIPGQAATVTGAVVSINNLSAVVNITGLGSNFISNNGQIIQISGESIPTGQFYPNSNPNQFYGTGNIIKMNTFLNSGIETQFINYPFFLSNKPTSINCDFENEVDNYIYNHSISGVNNSGFYISFSDFLSNSGYSLYITILV